MKPAFWIGLFLLTAPSWAQPVRRSVGLGRVVQPARSASRHGMVRARAAEPPASAPTQAAGVIQTNLLDASNVVWFVTADTLPAGTLLTPFVIFPDGTSMPLDAVTLTEDVAAGTSFDLPNVRKFGYFWPQGLMTYGVIVTNGGRDTQAAADFPVYAARDYENVKNMVPRISSTNEVLSNGDVMVSVAGVFTPTGRTCFSTMWSCRAARFACRQPRLRWISARCRDSI